jgi:hypothetical protein
MAVNKDNAGFVFPLSIADQPVANGCRHPPIDLSHHYSYATSKRVESSVKHFYKYFTIPGIGNLAAGTLL